MESKIKITNTLTGQKEAFVPRDEGKVAMYACGLTPQDAPHIGHIRGAIVMDVIRRWFEASGYEVVFVQNFTDIDDKIINKMRAENTTAEEVANKYSAMYEGVLDSLGVKPITFVRVTTNMQDIVAMVQRLIEKGYAYETDGDVYYSVPSFNEYGKLSKRNVEDMRAGERIEVDERKKNPMDFALWKAAKPGEPSWDSPWGKGRPGWHIECSTLSLKYLGACFDIHAGGTDLVFPHHENEIAQSEAYLDNQYFCKYWLHWGAIRAQGEKMSKSLGNDAKINVILEKYSPDAVRLYLLGTSYRSPIEYSAERLEEAANSLGRIQRAVSSAEKALSNNIYEPSAVAEPLWERFADSMNDDFNTAGAMSAVFDAVTALNKITSQAIVPSADLPNLSIFLSTLRRMLDCLGIRLLEQNDNVSDILKCIMDKVIEWRKILRQQKQFAIADQIRNDLTDIGIILEDGPLGTSWRKE